MYTYPFTPTFTNVMLASASATAAADGSVVTGRVYVFEDTGSQAVCKACIDPRDFDAQISYASFVSSPGFTTHSVSAFITAIIIGAEITRGSSTYGKLYSFNIDGSLRWQYPRTQDLPNGITSAPAILNASVYALDDGGGMYAVSQDGVELWRSTVRRNPTQTPAPAESAETNQQSNVHDPEVDFAPAVVGTGALIYVNTVDGEVIALDTSNGAERWRYKVGSESLAASMVLGVQPLIDPTPTATMNTPTPTPTPTPSQLGAGTPSSNETAIPVATLTASPTPTAAFSESTLFAVAKDGSIAIVESRFGVPVPTPSDSVVGIEDDVFGSPALTTDGYLIFADKCGTVYAINGTTLQPYWSPFRLSDAKPPTPTPAPEPPPTPAACSVGVRSSVAIAGDGTIWLGANDGKLYRLGIQ
ncbi:MAG: PQQ-binding-like beta-propeller repeat protein [Deltaproteobacteria bacterium]|nr:PQQ-binding-like beta-propeller repeat protein [Deltaproteobacteria bacterium]